MTDAAAALQALLTKGFDALLDHDRVDDLARLHRLAARLADGGAALEAVRLALQVGWSLPV